MKKEIHQKSQKTEPPIPLKKSLTKTEFYNLLMKWRDEHKDEQIKSKTSDKKNQD